MIQTALHKQFFSKLPVIVRNDIEFQVRQREKRASATLENVSKFQDSVIKLGLKRAPLIERKFPFAESRKGVARHENMLGLDHHIIMDDSAVEALVWRLVQKHTGIMKGFDFDEESESETRSYVDVLRSAHELMSESLRSVFITAPCVKPSEKFNGKTGEEERELEIAIRRCLCPDWMKRKFLFLRAQYVEYAQIAMDRVGKKGNQRKYISAVSFAAWMQKQREAMAYLENMAVVNADTQEIYNLKDVVARTTANPENRRIEMMVRSRGNEERAIDLGYVGVFITWTLPSKYHPSSKKWDGSSIKEGHRALMKKWEYARARLAKVECLEYFGFRVAEPHKDGCSHAHMFLFCKDEHKQTLVETIKAVAIEEDRAELGDDVTPRFDVKFADPEKGGATAYIAKYVSKNINGKHLPESDAEKDAYAVRAWASTHRIRQFQAFGTPSVGLWRQLRRVSASDTAFCEKLDELRNAADKSRWCAFCELIGDASLAYEESLGKYGEVTRRVIGFNWGEKVIETALGKFTLVLKKDAQRLLQSRGAASWSTENNCNSQLIEHLRTLTGWSYQGVQCLISPLLRGAKIPIDKHQSVSLRNGGLVVC